MFLNSNDIPDLQQLISESSDATISKIKNAEISLSVALFLAITHRTLWLKGDVAAAGKIARLGLPGVSQAINCLLSGAARCPKPFAAPPFDLFRISSKLDLLSQDWLLFCDRFRRSADGGKNGKMFVGIAAVLGEMGDNVVCHAFEKETGPCAALAGFYVADGTASFCVIDAGQGFLSSLRRSETWKDLQDDHDALEAVISKHATSRFGEREGGGFKQLFNSLLDFNGLVVLRSGKAVFRLSNQGPHREICSEFSTFVPGACVMSVFAKSGVPREISLKNTS